MAGTHDFVVPDEASAQASAEELAAHGFPRVFARPHPDGGWVVMALDEGPYPVDTVGHRQVEAVSRDAAVIVRAHGGRPDGGSRFDVSRIAEFRTSTAPIEVIGAKSRPPVPEVIVVSAPPLAPLALTPDVSTPGTTELPGLDDVPWADLEHAHGPADDVPDLLRELAGGTQEWDEVLGELFGDDLLHQGDCHEATAPALPFLTELIVADVVPAPQRRALYLWLLIAGGRRNDNLVGFAELARGEGEPLQPGAWTEEVFRTVGDQVPVLLDRWDAEPQGIRFVLAILAAQHPGHGLRAADGIAALAAELDGTQQGAYLRLALELVHGRDERALALATEIVSWSDRLEPRWLEAPGVPDGIKAAHVLTEGALSAIE
ncbi:hypothetical protein JOD64_003130 [Micromonospora luteifusca]|uniref:Uncharacterized protein n=1 Tax=Micromonospora luteifusca TaxID=709860 RepID=A0ABS2LUP7_9ACTN|nr:hypothetical protein [Micromonospora luteifusca]MBM7491908.1 hypothetical protein [Micromonospora luteifusca]